MTNPLFRSHKHLRKSGKLFRAINDTARIVRVVQDDRLGLHTNHPLRLFYIERKTVLFQGNHLQNPFVVGNIGAILGKVRCKSKDFIPLIQKATHQYVQTACGSCAKENIFFAVALSKTLIQMFGNRCPNILKARIFHIPVNLMRILVLQETDNRILHFIRNRRHGISQAEIIHSIFPVLFRHILPHFKHLPNHGIACHETFHRAC